MKKSELRQLIREELLKEYMANELMHKVADEAIKLTNKKVKWATLFKKYGEFGDSEGFINYVKSNIINDKAKNKIFQKQVDKIIAQYN